MSLNKGSAFLLYYKRQTTCMSLSLSRTCDKVAIAVYKYTV